MKRIATYLKFTLCLIGLSVGSIAYAQDWFEMTKKDGVNFYDVVRVAEKHYSTHPTGRGSGYKLYQRWKYFTSRIIDDEGNIPSQSDILEAKKSFDKKYQGKSSRRATNGDWTELGPFGWRHSGSWNPGVGRITALAVEPNQQQLLFAGSPGGGIWRSRDGAQNWEPLGDQMDNMHIYGIGIDPHNNNTIYCLNGAGRILKSTNQGDSWAEIGNTGNGIGRNMSIIFHPNNPGTILFASASGVWKTTNSGGSFNKVLNTYIEDLAFRPNDPNTVYACGDRFYKSTNGGDSFSEKSSGIVSTQRMRMSVTPANNNYVYLVQKDGGSFGHFYRSTNSGENFQERAANNNPYLTQADRDMAIMASWSNAEEVHVAGMNNHRSRDGGNSFEELSAWSSPSDPSYIHADVEIMMCVNDVFYTGSDGGVFRSTNHGDNYTDLSSLGGLAVHQFYRIGGTPQDPNMMIGGSQDNGVNVMKNNDGTWNAWLGADGMESFIDPTNTNIVYGMTQNGGMNKSDNGGGNRVTINQPVDGGNWVTPFFPDPSNGSNIYAGYDGLYRSTDRGINWSKISNGVNTGGNIDEATIAPSNNNYIYMAKGNNFWRTTNGQSANPTWALVNGFSGNVNFIAVDPNDPARVAIACNGSRVYVSTNAGSNWTDKRMNLPNSGAECVVFDDNPNNGLYIGTDNAIYYTSDDQSSWLYFSNGLPATAVRDFEISFSTRKIRVGTHGRGMFESPLFNETGVSASTGVVTVYEHCNGGGFSGGLSAGDYTLADLQALGVQDDWISSIRMAEGFKVIAFLDDNFGGQSLELTSNTECLAAAGWNDKITSIQVKANGDPSLSGLFYLQNRVSNKVLDIHGWSLANGGNAIQYTFAGNANQQFSLEHQGDGAYRVISKYSGKSLDIDLNTGNALQYDWHGGTNQRFIAVPTGDGFYKLIVMATGKVVEVSGASQDNLANVAQWDNAGQANSHWRLNGESTNLVTASDECDLAGFSSGFGVGDYTSADMQNRFLGNDRMSSIVIPEGFKVILYMDDNFTGQSIELTGNVNCFSAEWEDKVTSMKVRPNGLPDQNDTYYIENRASGLFADVNGGVSAIENGATIIQSTFNGNDNQQFELTDYGDGSYSIIAKHSGKGFDVEGISTVSGAAIHQWEYLGGSNQRFILFPTGDGYFKLIAEHTAMVVEVSTNDAGEQLHQWDNHNGTNAQWVIIPVNSVIGSGDGLRANYFNGMDFEMPVMSRVDPEIDLDWGNGAPAVGVDANQFTTRWTGQLQAKTTAEYTIYLNSDNGRRLWLDDQLLIDEWQDDHSIDYSAKVNLTAGEFYDIRIDYFENVGGANIELSWSSKLLPRELIPQTQLVSNALPISVVTSPEDNATLEANEPFLIDVASEDVDGDIDRVEIFVNGEYVTTITDAPYVYQMVNAAIGTYVIYADAYDNMQAIASTEEVTANVAAVTGVSEAAAGAFSIYPNPVTDRLEIVTTQDLDITSIRLIDVHGKMVHEGTLIDASVDVSSLSSGVYSVELLSQDMLYVKRFVKK